MTDQLPPKKSRAINLPLVGGSIAILVLLVVGGLYLRSLLLPTEAPVDAEGTREAPALDIPEAIPEEDAPGTPTPNFLDDFDDGLDPVWTVHYGDPFVVDGRLTSNVGAGIAAGDASWRNYRVDFCVDTTQSDFAFTESSNSIGVRAADFDHAYWFVFTSCEAGWSLFPGGVLRGEVSLFPNTRVDFSREVKHITIDVKDNEMSVYDNGLLLSSIEDSSFEVGGIFVQLEARTFYDNFQVTLLP